MLKLYHAEPVANSLKTLIALREKGLEFESVYVDLHKFEQHQPWFVALNPEGQVPLLDHDGALVTHTSVIAEYLEDAFPDAPSLRPADPLGKARMRARAKRLLAEAMDSMEVGAAAVEGIKNNTPYIFTHQEFRDEVRGISDALDAAFPQRQQVTKGRQDFEDGRRKMVVDLRALAMKD